MLNNLHGHREKREEISAILPNRSVCFAGRKLPYKIPLDGQKAEQFREALDIFIMLINHNRGENLSNGPMD